MQVEEAGRHRIERDIHDGVQQQLVALVAKLRLARNQLQRDPALAQRTLREIQEDMRQALEDLRELAPGIHPPLLSDRGLVAAVEARTARLPLGVRVEENRLAEVRYAQEVEGAAYFLVCEGLANVLKHARARRVMVRLTEEDSRLHVEVADDGQGFDPKATAESGLRGLADRIEALGGTPRVFSRPAQGTRLMADLPALERQYV